MNAPVHMVFATFMAADDTEGTTGSQGVETVPLTDHVEQSFQQSGTFIMSGVHRGLAATKRTGQMPGA